MTCDTSHRAYQKLITIVNLVFIVPVTVLLFVIGVSVRFDYIDPVDGVYGLVAAIIVLGIGLYVMAHIGFNHAKNYHRGVMSD